MSESPDSSALQLIPIQSFRGSPKNPDLAFDETAKALARNGVSHAPTSANNDAHLLVAMLCTANVSIGRSSGIHDEAVPRICCKRPSHICTASIWADEPVLEDSRG